MHYTIPKCLLYRYSDFAKSCLEGNFFEASANAVWLPDVEPDVFQWLWQMLYTQRIDVFVDDGRNDNAVVENVWKACETLCQVHILGERLLFEEYEILRKVQKKIRKLIKLAKEEEIAMPWTPDIIHKVLSESTPYQLYGYRSSESLSMRPFLLESLSSFDFCANFDFLNNGEILKLDGQFAASLMHDMAREIKWAVELWGAQTLSSVDVTEKKLQLAQEEGNSQTITKRPKGGVWLALRYACTYSGCTTIKFEAYSQCFELDGQFTAELLSFMATELKWVVERWGLERGPKVDVDQEKEDERWNREDYDEIARLDQRNWWR